MNHFQIVISLITGLVSLVTLLIGLIVRITTKWTRIEDQLKELTKDMKEIVDDKTEAHRRLYEVIKEDRKNSDRRLRYLEERVWPNRRD